MNKTAKGGLAAGAAAVLLLGGAGTLAFWSDDATVNGGSVNSGFLFIDPVNIGSTSSPCDASWVYSNGTKAGTNVVNIVPGDKITKKCTFKVGAQGDNLQATPTVPTTVAVTKAPENGATPAGGNGASFSATVDTSYKLGTAAQTTAGTAPAFTASNKVTEADNDKILTATFVVTIPYGTNETGNPKVNANDTQNITATLDALTVRLVQDQAAGNPN